MDKNLRFKYVLVIVIIVCVTAIICTLRVLSRGAGTQEVAPNGSSNQAMGCSHIWRESTCTTPKSCKLCGIETGGPRGHQWLAATCTSPKKCAYCGETQGQELSHNWKEATGTTPKLCTRCGAEDGTIKTYNGGSYGMMTEEWVSFSQWDVHPYLMSVKMKNCVSFTFTLRLWAVEYGSPYGTWEVYCKDNSGKWIHVDDIDVQENNMSVTINLKEPLSFTEIAVNRASTKGCKHKFEIEVTGYSIYED